MAHHASSNHLGAKVGYDIQHGGRNGVLVEEGELVPVLPRERESEIESERECVCERENKIVRAAYL